MLYSISFLLIYFLHSSLCLLIPFPYLAPSHFFSPLVTTSFTSVSMSPFLFYYIIKENKQTFICFIFWIPLVSDNVEYLSFSVWLTSLRSVHVVVSSRISFFLWLSNIPLCIYTSTTFFFIHSSVDKHLDCFHVLAVVNNAAMSIRLNISFEISVFVFFWYIPSSGVSQSYGNSVFSFFEQTSHCFP